MGKVLACWLVGLVGVGSIAGCGLVRNCHDECGEQAGGCKVRKQCDSCRSERQVLSGNSWSDQDVVSPVKEKAPSDERPAPSSTERIQPPKRLPLAPLPEVIPPPKRMPLAPITTTPDQPTNEGAALDEETLIVNRELASLGSRGTAESVDSPGAMRQPVEPTVVNSDGVPSAAMLLPSRSQSVAPAPLVIVTGKGAANDKSAAIKSVDIVFGPADNYQSITGEVRRFGKTVRLRYAAIDQEDLYGGAVVLDGGEALNKLRDGQLVRVRGDLIPPPDRAHSAHFRVLAIEVLD
jgi:hypothetical protein